MLYHYPMIGTVAILLCMLLYSSKLIRIGGGNSYDFAKFDTVTTLPLRGILAFLIICTHFGSEFGQEWPWVSEWNWWGGTSVGVFFFLSGYGLAVSFASKGSAYISSFPRRRARSILPPFIFMTLAAIVWNCYADGISLTDMWTKFLTGNPPLATSWFIYALILYYTAFYISARLTKSPLRTGIWLTASTLVYMATLMRLHFGGFWYSSIMAANIGYFFALYSDRLLRLLGSRPATVTVLTGVLLACSATGAAWRRDLFQPCLTSVLPVAIWIIYVTVRMRVSRVLNFLGRVSYEIYLCQGFYIVAVATLPAATAMPVLYAATIVTAVVLHQLCKARGGTKTAIGSATGV